MIDYEYLLLFFDNNDFFNTRHDRFPYVNFKVLEKNLFIFSGPLYIEYLPGYLALFQICI